MKKIKSLKELCDEFKVRLDFNHVDSSIVYPMDTRKYEFHGYMNDEDVQDHISLIAKAYGKSLTSDGKIVNKYAIPVFESRHMHNRTVFFMYYHDTKTWLISLTTDKEEYAG
jgi:hypothetical protein